MVLRRIMAGHFPENTKEMTPGRRRVRMTLFAFLLATHLFSCPFLVIIAAITNKVAEPLSGNIVAALARLQIHDAIRRAGEDLG